MAIKQVSVFVENKKGAIVQITDTLAAAGINLRSMCIADTEGFGILRMIADDGEKAAQILKDAGFTAKNTDVVGFAVPDEPGGLGKVLGIFSNNEINIEYMYALITGEKGKAYCAARVDGIDRAEALLAKNGVALLSDKDI